jgi:hypothetical protein
MNARLLLPHPDGSVCQLFVSGLFGGGLTYAPFITGNVPHEAAGA